MKYWIRKEKDGDLFYIVGEDGKFYDPPFESALEAKQQFMMMSMMGHLK